jgi:hypothetical protein
MLNARTGVSRLRPAEPGTAGGFGGKEEEEEFDAYKVEVLAVPVLMLSEFERPNIAVEARRFAPWNAGLDIATVSLLLFVCCCGWKRKRSILTSLKTEVVDNRGGWLLFSIESNEGQVCREDKW